jgi:hypothetical protein
VSAELGKYVAVNDVVDGLNAPLPLVDHCPPVAIVTFPFRLTFELFPQTVMSAPAVTTGASVRLITSWSVTALHPPLFVDVSVSVTVPAAVSAALGM